MLTTSQLAHLTCETRGHFLTCENPRVSSGEQAIGAPATDHPNLTDVPSVTSIITALDLTMVKRKLMDSEEGPGWSEELAGRVEIRYRRFLELCLRFPELSIVPTHDIDAMWHAHILDTRAYANDCERIFGQFMHHYPYFGMHGDADYRDLVSSFEATAALYRAFFEEEYYENLQADEVGPKNCLGAKCVKCGSGPVKCHHQPTRCK